MTPGVPFQIGGNIVRIMISFVCLALAAIPAAADTLHLKDGSRVDGTFLGGDSRQVKFLRSNGSVKNYSVSDVAELTFGDTPAAARNESIAAPRPAPRSNRAAAPARRGGTARRSSVTIPQGTVVTVRLIDSIDADVTGVGERFRASIEEAVIVDGREVITTSDDAFVEVARVEQAGRVRGRDEISLELAAVKVNDREYELDTNYAELASKSQTKRTAKSAGGGAALGAIIGAIAGGGKGAAIGAGIGAGAGTVYSATRGQKLQIPSETLLTFSLRAAVRM